MEDLLQFGALLVSIIAVFVTLFLMLLKIERTLLTKEDLNKITGDFCLEIKYGFKEVNQFEEAAAHQEQIL